MIRITASRTLPHLKVGGGTRTLTFGGASSQGIDQYVSKCEPNIMPRKRMPRTGWQIPFVGYGTDNVGTPASDRQGTLHAAAAKKGCNLFSIDGGGFYVCLMFACSYNNTRTTLADEIFRRRWPHAREYAPRVFEQDWEYFALRRLMVSEKARGLYGIYIVVD